MLDFLGANGSASSWRVHCFAMLRCCLPTRLPRQSTLPPKPSSSRLCARARAAALCRALAAVVEPAPLAVALVAAPLPLQPARGSPWFIDFQRGRRRRTTLSSSPRDEWSNRARTRSCSRSIRPASTLGCGARSNGSPRRTQMRPSSSSRSRQELRTRRYRCQPARLWRERERERRG